MKPKHQSLAVVSVLLLSVIAAIGYSVYQFKFVGDDIAVASPPVFQKISVPTAREIQTMGELGPKFSDLVLPDESVPGPVALEIFGYRRFDHPLAARGEYAGRSSENPDYTLTFTFSAGRRRFCIIDGFFYPQGGLLPDGAKILRIDPYKVLVQKEAQRIWIPLAAPKNVADTQPVVNKLSKKAGAGG